MLTVYYTFIHFQYISMVLLFAWEETGVPGGNSLV